MKSTLEYKGFTGVFNWDNDTNVYYGDVINIRDTITFEGDTLEEVEQEFHNSVDDYLEFISNNA